MASFGLSDCWFESRCYTCPNLQLHKHNLQYVFVWFCQAVFERLPCMCVTRPRFWCGGEWWPCHGCPAFQISGRCISGSLVVSGRVHSQRLLCLGRPGLPGTPDLREGTNTDRRSLLGLQWLFNAWVMLSQPIRIFWRGKKQCFPFAQGKQVFRL